MPSIEYQGLKFSGGKFFIILSLIGAIVGGGWTGYKFYDDYLSITIEDQYGMLFQLAQDVTMEDMINAQY